MATPARGRALREELRSGHCPGEGRRCSAVVHWVFVFFFPLRIFFSLSHSQAHDELVAKLLERPRWPARPAIASPTANRGTQEITTHQEASTLESTPVARASFEKTQQTNEEQSTMTTAGLPSPTCGVRVTQAQPPPPPNRDTSASPTALPNPKSAPGVRVWEGLTSGQACLGRGLLFLVCKRHSSLDLSQTLPPAACLAWSESRGERLKHLPSKALALKGYDASASSLATPARPRCRW